MQSSRLSAGDWVEVRTKEEILKTLDKEGRLDGLPFMPEMANFCGQRLRVFKRAHKTCDPPNGLGGRRMLRTVHLEDVRCDGAAHGGCQARCLLFWKEAWLKTSKVEAHEGSAGCTDDDLVQAACCHDDPSGPRYTCQSTELSLATQPLPWWDLRQYIEDYTSGNARLLHLASAFLFFLYQHLVSAGLGLGAPLRWIYDAVQKLRGGTPYPARPGRVPRGTPTPSAKLDLRPGDLVRVKPYNEILTTLDENSHNRGMCFDPEMVPYCGGEYRVLSRIHTIIDETSGRMRHLKNECIVLENVVCKACYAKHRRFCPRSIYPYWREIWLERVQQRSDSDILLDEK